MSIGERIRFFRNLKGMTQKQLGVAVGFPEGSADVRLAQYETGSRSPRAELTRQLAKVLGVSVRALNVPNLDSQTGVMHTLFALEDQFGLQAVEKDGQVVLALRPGTQSAQLQTQLEAWASVRQKLAEGEISREDYDRWRYFYPEGER